MRAGGKERNSNIYAAYKGDEYIMEGTLGELCKALGKNRRTLLLYTYPSYQARMEALRSQGKRKSRGRFSLVLVDSHQETPFDSNGKGGYVKAHVPQTTYDALKQEAQRRSIPISEVVRECCRYALEKGLP